MHHCTTCSTQKHSAHHCTTRVTSHQHAKIVQRWCRLILTTHLISCTFDKVCPFLEQLIRHCHLENHTVHIYARTCSIYLELVGGKKAHIGTNRQACLLLLILAASASCCSAFASVSKLNPCAWVCKNVRRVHPKCIRISSCTTE